MTPSLLIRFAMLTGVLLFGGVVYSLRRSGDIPGVTGDQATSLLWVGRALWATAIVGCVVVFQAIQRTRSATRARALQIVGWALGEMVALYGGVIWFLTGSPSWYVPGLVYLIMTLLAFPARRG